MVALLCLGPYPQGARGRVSYGFPVWLCGLCRQGTTIGHLSSLWTSLFVHEEQGAWWDADKAQDRWAHPAAVLGGRDKEGGC